MDTYSWYYTHFSFISDTDRVLFDTPATRSHVYLFFTARPHASGDQAEGGGGRHPVMTRTRLPRISGLSLRQRCDRTLPVVFH